MPQFQGILNTPDASVSTPTMGAGHAAACLLLWLNHAVLVRLMALNADLSTAA